MIYCLMHPLNEHTMKCSADDIEEAIAEQGCESLTNVTDDITTKYICHCDLEFLTSVCNNLELHGTIVMLT